MDEFRGGKFIVGNDVRLSEQKRQAGEYLRNKGEEFRNGNEYTRNEIASKAIGVANTYTKTTFLTQIGLFIVLVFAIIIVATIAGLAYEKSYNNTSLVNLNNLRDLTLSNLTVNDTSNLKTLTLTGNTTSNSGISTTSGLSVGGKAYFYDDFVLEGGLSINGGLSVGTSAYFYGDIFAEGGLSINGAGSIGVCHLIHGDLTVTGNTYFNGVLNVSSSAYLNNNLRVSNTLTVNEKAHLKKLNTVVINDNDIYGVMPGLSGAGYSLTSDLSGTVYLVSHGNNIEHTNITFILPEPAEAENFKFIWHNGTCYVDNKKFILQTLNSSHNINGIINLNEANSGNCYAINASATPSVLPTAIKISLLGVINPGSVIECVSNGLNWYASGNIGISSMTNVSYTGAYSVSGDIGAVNLTYEFSA